MDERFIRNFPSLKPEEQEILASKRIFIAGLGGLGGYLLEFMLRLGVTHITVCDADSFIPSNLNRQLLSLSENCGEKKLSAALKRARSINPLADIKGIGSFINEDNAEEFIRGSDVVLDGLDNASGRKALLCACSRLSLPYIYGAVQGFSAQASILMPGSKALDILYPDGRAPEKAGILSFTPALGAALEASLCLRLLCGRAVDTGRLYCMDLLHMDFMDLNID